MLAVYLDVTELKRGKGLKAALEQTIEDISDTVEIGDV